MNFNVDYDGGSNLKQRVGEQSTSEALDEEAEFNRR